MQERRPNWLVQKLSDYWLSRTCPAGLESLRQAALEHEKEVHFVKQRNELIYGVVDYLSESLRNPKDLARLLSVHARNDLAERYRESFRELQVDQRNLVVGKLEQLVSKSVENTLTLREGNHFAQGVQCLSASLDNHELRNSVTRLLTPNLPPLCKQAIFQAIQGYRYQDTEQSYVTEIASLLRNSQSSLSEIKILIDSSEHLLSYRMSGQRNDEGRTPLVDFFCNIVNAIPRFPELDEKKRSILLMVCSLGIELPLRLDLLEEELEPSIIGKEILHNLTKIIRDPECRNLALWICSKFREQMSDQPSGFVKGLRIKVDSAVRIINQVSSPSVQ